MARMAFYFKEFSCREKSSSACRVVSNQDILQLAKQDKFILMGGIVGTPIRTGSASPSVLLTPRATTGNGRFAGRFIDRAPPRHLANRRSPSVTIPYRRADAHRFAA